MYLINPCIIVNRSNGQAVIFAQIFQNRTLQVTRNYDNLVRFYKPLGRYDKDALLSGDTVNWILRLYCPVTGFPQQDYPPILFGFTVAGEKKRDQVVCCEVDKVCTATEVLQLSKEVRAINVAYKFLADASIASCTIVMLKYSESMFG